MIGSAGFDALLAAELAHADAFGRENGFHAVQWMESECVTTALQTTVEPEAIDSYRTVLRMHALAIHQLDNR